MDSASNTSSDGYKSLAKELTVKGWYLSLDGIKQCLDTLKTKAPKDSVPELLKAALNENLKHIGSPCLPIGINGSKIPSVPGNLVLQVQKIINVAVPQQTDQEHSSSPRLLKIVLSDGHTSCQALEVESLPEINLKTPPGTKIRLKKDIPIVHGFLFLKSGSIEFLGGHVEKLIAKWTVAQSLLNHERPSGRSDGAPQWVPFGQPVRASKDLLEPPKPALKEETPEVKERNRGFELQRQDAIAQAARSGGTKSFQGTGKQLVDRKVQKIVNAGFSVEDAEQTLRLTRYDVERALQRLQPDSEGGRPDFGRGGRGRRGRRGQGWLMGDDYEDPCCRPRDSMMTLIQYLPAQMAAEMDIEDVAPPAAPDMNSQSFRPREEGRGYRGGRGDRRGGRGERRGGGRGRGDSYGRRNDFHGNYSENRPKYSANQLVNDMEAWPGLNEEPVPSKQPERVQPKPSFALQVPTLNPSINWSIQDYCLALHPTHIKYLPAVIQELDARTATVLFIETGDIELVDLRNLKGDPQDDSKSFGPVPAYHENTRGNNSSGRVASRPRGAVTFRRGGRRTF